MPLGGLSQALHTEFSTDQSPHIAMISSRSSKILLCLTCTFLIVDAVSQGGYQAQCKKFQTPASGENTQCPDIKKPVCGTDGQTYKNLCEFCKAAMEKNGQIGYKHDGKC